ncbi:MAG: hypothetical protein IPI33_04105 [Dehalococcoidia bacterium]|jgi:hypothetical protein|uniref:hypothetical protein n=1 Tax=Candidatus Amarobacter glycogenicus TaxID=3140699 RepID=UPI001D8393F5|nr:hypothetical protein [Dehalococcoidia bacterium]MBK6561839.1 hypothetical protein [Dehalococcoidia bacterium]MBK7330707.1 hypothetical protein [Dehalococcoidia bacterium]MBK7724436.1 hypothetical protein [Dehalococcoidia bacterium]MBK8558564.1 hypothetical protein [Dehalococcoidia bacterium]
MARARGFFGPSERALEFGKQYAEVLQYWGEFFASGSKLVGANVKLGELASDAAKEWDQWVKETANAPWNWMNPDVMKRMMGGVPPTPKAQ